MKDELEAAVEAIGALPLKRWCEITGENVNAVHQRIYRKVWKDGVHVTKAEGGGWWVQLAAVRDWIAGATPAEMVASAVRAELGLEARPGTDCPSGQ